MRQSTECYSSSTPHWWGSWDMWLQRMSVRFTCCGTSCLCLSSDFSCPPVPSVYWLLQRACPPSVPSATAPGETAATDGRGVCGGAVVAAKTPLVGATRCTSASRVVFFFFVLFLPVEMLKGFWPKKVTVDDLKSEILHRKVGRGSLWTDLSESMQNFFGEVGFS